MYMFQRGGYYKAQLQDNVAYYVFHAWYILDREAKSIFHANNPIAYCYIVTRDTKNVERFYQLVRFYLVEDIDCVKSCSGTSYSFLLSLEWKTLLNRKFWVSVQ